MEWSQLSKMEASWVLSSGQKAMLAESILQKAHAPRALNLSILKPILVTAAVALILLGGLLLWGQRPMEEQIVTIPGASSEAKPGEYIENQDPSKEEVSPTPPKEEGAEKPPAAEEKLPAASGEEKEEKPSEKEQKEEKIHRFWETEKEMPYEEAVAIVKEKLENRPHETLTDKERMAYYQCISATVYAEYLYAHESYLQYSDESRGDRDKKPYADPESPNYRTDNPWMRINFITTKDGVGDDFQTETPIVFDEGYRVFDLFSPAVREITQKTNFDTSYLNDEHVTLSTLYGTGILTTKTHELECGIGYGGRSFNFENVNILKEKLSKKTVQEIVRYYLSFESVTWVNIYFEDIYISVEHE